MSSYTTHTYNKSSIIGKNVQNDPTNLITSSSSPLDRLSSLLVTLETSTVSISTTSTSITSLLTSTSELLDPCNDKTKGLSAGMRNVEKTRVRMNEVHGGFVEFVRAGKVGKIGTDGTEGERSEQWRG